ncbi:hypothetical protein BDQ17DRAFT_1330762 [Cyathus striatus]|nr:hypothetical protein BDQ17DRAFT_1330762 [Cyathus striatus]
MGSVGTFILPVTKTQACKPPPIEDVQANASEKAIESLADELQTNLKLSATIEIPDDIFREIFGHVLHDKVIDIGKDRDAIWDLCNVCVRWRDIIQDMPSLWSNFKVSGTNICSTSITNRIKLCLKLSKMHGLSISLLPLFPKDFPTKALEHIAMHADRVMSLSIDNSIIIRMTEYTSVTSLIRQKGLGQLQKFAMRGKKDDKVPLNSILNVVAFPQAPLKKLDLRYLKAGNVEEFLAILEVLSSALEELTWGSNLVKSDFPDPRSLKVVVLPSLYTINVCDTSNYSLRSDIWSYIRVPNISKVYFHNSDTTHYWDYEIREIWSVISSSRITRLYICTCQPFDLKFILSDLGTAINLFPALQVFELKIDGDTFWNVHIRKYVEDLLPNIIRSRSIEALNVANQSSRLPTPLLTIILEIVPPSVLHDCIPSFKKLEDLGEESGIQVVIRAKGYQSRKKNVNEGVNAIKIDISIMHLVQCQVLEVGFEFEEEFLIHMKFLETLDVASSSRIQDELCRCI